MCVRRNTLQKILEVLFCINTARAIDQQIFLWIAGYSTFDAPQICKRSHKDRVFLCKGKDLTMEACHRLFYVVIANCS